MLLIQLFIVIFALFALTRTWRQFKKGTLTFLWFFFWMIFWVATGVVAVLPQTTDIVARFVGVGRGADVVIYASLLSLFYLVFRLYVKIEQVEREITELVRHRALDEFEKGKNH